jgi:hypothetical protein
MRPYQRELLQDASLLCTVLFNWLGAAAIADAFSPTVNAKRAVSVYVATIAVAVNGYSLARSASFLGKGDAPKESIPGLFAEIVNLTQVWGTLFAVARYFSLPDDHDFYARSLLRVVSESIFEMSLVQAGVGWAAEAPVTVLERLVAWMAAYLGGVLCTNLFLVSVVLGRRGYWDRSVVATPRALETAETRAVTGVRVPLMVSLR